MKDEEKISIPTSKRLKALGFGNFMVCLFLVLFFVFIYFSIRIFMEKGLWIGLLATLGMVVVEILVFFTGIITIYLTSVQTKLWLKVLGIVVGWAPGLNLIALGLILHSSVNEYRFEMEKLKLNRERASERKCETKYPILMVHGIFFRDSKLMNYWGRIPAELERNGAQIFYGKQDSADTVEESARYLCERIDEILEETGAAKVNIIAHSKGGLDAKYAIAKLGAADKICSVTTINTPHKGCEFAEYLLENINDEVKEKVDGVYNAMYKVLGDDSPNFLKAVSDLTTTRCKEISECCDSFEFAKHGVFTQSVGSCMKKAASGAFPLNMSYKFVDKFDGPNDGLVGEPSFHWGEKYIYLENKYHRGISHGDVIDLNRENIYGFDVREFFVELVADLKERGF